MLKLSRKKGQRIIIEYGDILIIVQALGKNHYGEYKIGIDAKKEIKILREEIYNKNKCKEEKCKYYL